MQQVGGFPSSRPRGRQGWAQLVVALGMLASVALSSGCGQDPQAASRDQASRRAREIADALVLPAGYGRGEVTDIRAQTENENRGGGQPGSVTIHFDSPAGASFADVMHAFDTWAMSQGYVRVKYGSSGDCQSKLVSVAWGSAQNLLRLYYIGPGQPLNGISIPYSVNGVVTTGSSSTELVSDLPTCR